MKKIPIFIFIAVLMMACSKNFSLENHSNEKVVKEYICVGMDEKDVLKKFGRPTSSSEKNGTQILEYINFPLPKSASPVYGGFEVFIKNKKVTYLGIIYAKSHGPGLKNSGNQ